MGNYWNRFSVSPLTEKGKYNELAQYGSEYIVVSVPILNGGSERIMGDKMEGFLIGWKQTLL